MIQRRRARVAKLVDAKDLKSLALSSERVGSIPTPGTKTNYAKVDVVSSENERGERRVDIVELKAFARLYMKNLDFVI